LASSTVEAVIVNVP